MNKELIKKYSKEFNHWLNWGKILAYYKKDNEPRWLTDGESTSYDGVDNFSNIIEKSLSPDDVMIVINDCYREFRKALEEGKIVEYLSYTKEWKNLTENCRNLVGIPLEELRVIILFLNYFTF